MLFGLEKTNLSARLCSLSCFILTVGASLGSNQDVQFTFLLPAGSTECFYQTTTGNDSMEVEYQVNPVSLSFIGLGVACFREMCEQTMNFGPACKEIQQID